MLATPITTADPTDRPQRGANPRLDTVDTLVAIPGVVDGGGARLLNLSTTGACLEVGVSSGEKLTGKGQPLGLKLAHPKLNVALSILAEVMWSCEPSSRATRLGLRFLDPAEADRALRPFLAAEAGSCVFEDERLVGFLVPHGKAKKTWSLFETSGKRLAVASRDGTGFTVQDKTKKPRSQPKYPVASLHEALCRVIGVKDPLRADPRIPGWRGATAKAKPAPKPAPAPAPKNLAPTTRREKLRSEQTPRIERESVSRESVSAVEPVVVEIAGFSSDESETEGDSSAVKIVRKLSRQDQAKQFAPFAIGLGVTAIAAYLVHAVYTLIQAYTI